MFFILPKDAHSACLIQQRPAVEQTLDARENFIIKLQICLKFHGNYEYTPKYIPEEIALAQAVVESGWGTSRFAKEGNALFGIRTWDLSTPHLKPLGNPNAKFGVKKYNSWCHSVEDYLDTINTSQHYSEFRTLRDKGASTPALLDSLDKYSDIGYDWDRMAVPKSLSFFEHRWSTKGDTGEGALDFSGVWRFRELLPFYRDANEIVTIGEGRTNLQDARLLAPEIGLRPGKLFLQYEGLNPSGSFKDNGMTAAFTHARMVGAKRVACASTGDTSASLAAYAAAGGIPAIVLLPRGKVSTAQLLQPIAPWLRQTHP